MRVIVVGAGVMGLLTAWLLARQGHVVTVLDRGTIPNVNGASFDQHRLSHDFEASIGDAITLRNAADELWGRLWRDLHRSYLVVAPALAVSRASGDFAERSREAYARRGIEHEVISAGELEQRFPQIIFSGVRFGIMRTGGFLRAEEIVSAVARQVALLGVKLLSQTKITAIDARRTSVIVEDVRELTADAIVVTTGAWSSRLLPHLATRLAARRQAVVYPSIPQQWRQHWSQAPVIIDMGTPSGEWVAPPLSGLDLKFAASIHGRFESEGSDLMFAPDADEGEAILAHFRPHLRDWHGYVPVRVKVGFYAMSHDGSVVVERLGPGNIWIGTGCCGQGFKFAPVMASLLARCVAEESEPETVLSAFGFSQAPPPTAEFHASRLAG